MSVAPPVKTNDAPILSAMLKKATAAKAIEARPMDMAQTGSQSIGSSTGTALLRGFVGRGMGICVSPGCNERAGRSPSPH